MLYLLQTSSKSEVRLPSVPSEVDVLAGSFVNTAVDSQQQALSQVTSCAEELHLLSHLNSGYAASDGVVDSVSRSHLVVVFILNGIGIDETCAQNFLNGSGRSFDQRTVRFGSGAGPRLYRVFSTR